MTIELHQLRKRLAESLPGQEAQFKMAPRMRNRPSDPWQLPQGAVSSAVLLLLYPGENEWCLPLMVRTPDKTVHSKQVSLPGGRCEMSDRDFEHTALREAEEEVGVPAEKVEVLGKLTPLYIPVSNFFVQPIVGIISEKPLFIPDPVEVGQLLEIPASYLKDESKIFERNIPVSSGLRMNVPCYEFHGQIVWGATAMILSEFSELMY